MGGRNDLQVQINQQTQIKINEMSDRVNQRQVRKNFPRAVFLDQNFQFLNSMMTFFRVRLLTCWSPLSKILFRSCLEITSSVREIK